VLDSNAAEWCSAVDIGGKEGFIKSRAKREIPTVDSQVCSLLALFSFQVAWFAGASIKPVAARNLMRNAHGFLAKDNGRWKVVLDLGSAAHSQPELHDPEYLTTL